MMTDSQKGGGTIVVLGEMDTLEMRMEIAIAFPDWGKRWKKVSDRGSARTRGSMHRGSMHPAVACIQQWHASSSGMHPAVGTERQ